MRPTMLLVGLLAIVASACSSGSTAPTAPGGAATNQPPQTQSAGVNGGGGSGTMPCAAIAADVSAAVGEATSATDFTEADKCEYDFGGTTDAPGMDGIMDVRQEVAGSTDLSSVKLAFPGGDDVSNLGDAAYWASSVYVMYAVFHGNTYAVQSVLIDASKDLKTMETKVMQSLLSHL